MRIPEHVRDTVIEELYRQAVSLRWGSLSNSRRSAIYERWVKDAKIGGVLVGFLGSPARVRSWLKDGPLKHYENARHGAGSFARYFHGEMDMSARVVKAALGDDWIVDDATRQIKPLRFRARNGAGAEIVIIYGPSRKFRDLAWAAIVEGIAHEAGKQRVVVVRRPGEVVNRSLQQLHQAVADRCGFEVVWLELMQEG